MALSSGDVVDGKYQIVRLLGEGGMGAVYEGLNVRIHRKVAIKVLHGNVASNADAVKRFEREAQAAGRIGSKHIVEVLDLGDLPDGDRYMVMEFLEGEDLTTRIRSKEKLTPTELYPIAVQLLEGLAAAHDAGIIHRDLKPDNVYLEPGAPGQTDFVKILDFGISKFNSLGGEFSMTQTGAVMGTPYYMSPEQAKGSRELDQRTDLYAAGVILYEGLMGKVPFSAETFNELLFKIVLEDPPPLQVDDGPGHAEFAAIVRRAMARDVAERYQTAAEMKAALHAWAEATGVAHNPAVRHLTPHGGVGALSQNTAMAGTKAAWSATGEYASQAGLPKEGSRLKVALGVAALVLAGAAGVVWKNNQDTAEAQARATAQADDEERTRREAEQRARAEQERARAEEERRLLQKEKEKAEALHAEAAEALQAERKQNEEAQKEAAADKPAPRLAPRPRPSPPPKPAPAPESNTAKTSSGRTIRTTF